MSWPRAVDGDDGACGDGRRARDGGTWPEGWWECSFRQSGSDSPWKLLRWKICFYCKNFSKNILILKLENIKLK